VSLRHSVHICRQCVRDNDKMLDLVDFVVLTDASRAL
jgi:hypothetical protein